MAIREIPPELIERYSASVPRYTSYPTAVEFQNDFTADDWLSALRELEGALSLYVHIPFCPKLCYFCACNKIITEDRNVAPPYIDAVLQEMQILAGRLSKKGSVEQIHWGGGSPNFLNPEQMRMLHEGTRQIFPDLAQDAEVSIELDPRTTSNEQLETLRDLGFNRVSFGVQDFDREVQETINRVQSFEETSALADKSRALDFGGVNLDLIYGLPLQTEEGFGRTLEKVLEIRPDRIALYGYAHVTWLQKVQNSFRKFHLPTPEERIQLFRLAVERMLAAGYEHIGLDHFALPEDSLSQSLKEGTLARNFMGYTTHKGANLLGFGASSISTTPMAFAQNEKDPTIYRTRVEHGGLPIVRGLRRGADDQIRGELIEMVLCSGVIDFEDFEARMGINPVHEFPECFERADQLIADGLVELDNEEFRVTELGRYFARSIASIFDSYYQAHQQTERRVFSQAI